MVAERRNSDALPTPAQARRILDNEARDWNTRQTQTPPNLSLAKRKELDILDLKRRVEQERARRQQSA